MATIDPRIPLGVQPVQMPNRLAMAGQAAQLQSLGQQNRLMQMQQQQQEGLNQAYQDAFDPATGSVNRNRLIGVLAEGGLGAAIPDVQTSFAKQDKATADLSKAQLDEMSKRLDIGSQLLGSVTDQASYDRARSTALQMGFDVSQFPQQYDPAIVNEARMRALTTKEQLDLQLRREQFEFNQTQAGQTSLQRNLAAAGLRPGTPEYRDAVLQGTRGTTVNVGQSEYGTIPPGYELFTDPQTGARSMQPIAGGPVEREHQAALERAEAAKRNAANYARTVTQDIGVALEELENYGFVSRMDNPVGGLTAEASSRIPRTSEYNMKQFVDSALSNVTLDTMNRMRETSPAGATGFGNMSERQMEVIRGVLGQWKPGLPVDQQRYILHRLHNFYMDVVVGSREERNQAVRDGRMTREEANALDELYYPETRDLKGQPLNSSTDQGAAQLQAAPPIGSVEQGYEFLGGDPANPASWRRVGG